jgi:hypothetical protein
VNAADAPVVFVGPSVRREEIAAICGAASLRPPIQRGDLYREREQGGNVFLIIDGMFSQVLAVSPREIVDVLGDGAVVLGAASMGALRSAECWPAGMRGLGTIARLYRLGCLNTDDEVAVSTDPGREFRALSVALINVRFAVNRARHEKLLERAAGAAIVAAAERLHFTDRHWSVILEEAGLGARAAELEPTFRNFDLKRRDGLHAARELSRMIAARPSLARRPPTMPRVLGARTRYAGHHRYFGMAQAELAAALTRWLFGTGRYQPYLWPLVSGEPEMHAVTGGAADPDSRAEARRDALVTVLARRLTDFTALAAELWGELEFMDELDAESMRWYACSTVAALGQQPAAEALCRAREEVAIAHGVPDWESLEGELVDGKLFGAIPFAWIDESCRRMAQARSWEGLRPAPVAARSR